LEGHWDGNIPVTLAVFPRLYGVGVVREVLADEISGFIDFKEGRPQIHLNRSHSLIRQRFTLAHEFGHFVSAEMDQTATRFRNAGSSAGVDPEEIYANGFAAALLMPRIILAEMLETGADTRQLAREFGVSEEAMRNRLKSLGWQAWH
jgi:Zn-dependent peptidase ImmA (M78 family)